MLGFLYANMATIIICLLLVFFAGMAIRSVYRNHKSGGCSGCPASKTCNHCSCPSGQEHKINKQG